ncbi:hypothetical protein R7P80_01385 [Vibrio sp. 2092]|uniref:hypothetical protein n=1 Tax=Vibrio sp. 2092 TaxID=3074593 RepID=UPI002964B071|nr:hypothetical protein [Vibrio sp. 2092]MCA2471431.1 hypothetical protein [Vibrio alginolyticus]MDW2151450.1 hypothetical protein [Vibrio sp. 2092]
MNKLKKTVLAVVLGSSLTVSAPSHAIPNVDFANLTEEIVGNIQSASQWVSESQLMTAMMAADSYFQQAIMSMDSFLAQFSLQKELKLEESLHNLMVKEMSEPDKQAPRTCAIQKVSNAVDCVTTDTTVSKLDKDSHENNNFTDSQVKVTEKKVEKTKELIELCRNLQYADNIEGTDKLSTSLCLRGGILLGTETQDAYEPSEQVAADTIIDLITGPLPEHKKSQTLPEGSFEKDAMMVKEMRKLAIRSLAVASLQHIAAVRGSAGESSELKAPSELSLLQDFSDERWGNPEWVVEVAGATADQKDAVMPSELQRRMAVMQAFQIHLDILKYKQQLRMEALQASSLMLDVENSSNLTK